MALSQHKATIGRKLWLWSNYHNNAEDPAQPFDATVIFLHPDGDVKVLYTNHWGTTSMLSKVQVHDPEPDDFHGKRPDYYATWMPYQKRQMDSQNPV
jgi:hypothetical protein